MLGVWIAPVGAQVMMTLRVELMDGLLKVGDAPMRFFLKY
jgi:hypothetical protein